MNILFAMHFEPGHHLGTFRLAKELRSRGHAVAYLGIPQLRNLVEDQGFQFVEFAAHLFPTKPAPADPALDRSERKDRAAAEALFSRYTEAIVDGTLDECLLASRPDVLICDSFLWYVAMRGLQLKIPTVQISTSLFGRDNSRIPPAITPLTPRDSLLSRIRIFLAWKCMHARFQFSKRLASRWFGTYRAPTRMHHLVDTFRWVARRSNYPLRKNQTYLEDEIGAHLMLPEVVLCTEAFQFPGNAPAQRTYCGDFIDFDRQEASAPVDIQDKTAILCSLGTSAASYPHADSLFRAVEHASRMAPEWLFLLHVSDPKLITRYQPTSNLVVTAWVPQLAMLKHAAAMVSHGGLNSIMECVQNEVPMVLLPCARDQPGNAARAAYHHLAVTANIATITPDKLVTLIASAMDNAKIKAGLKRMKDAIAAEHGLGRAIGLVESLANRPELTLDSAA